MNSDAFKDRLATIMNGASKRSFAEKCGVSEGALRSYLKGDTTPDLDTLHAIADVGGCTLAWLAAGQGQMKRGEGLAVIPAAAQSEYIQVPRYEIAASAGGGAVVQSEQIVDYLTFKAEWLRMSLGLSPAQAAVISVVGDSMEPYLSDGDLILVDTSVTRIENDSIYVIQSGDSLLVKRIQRKLDGTVIVKSDNERYEPEVFRGEATELLRVVGRLVRRLVR